MRCPMCFFDRDESKFRPVIPNHPVRLCGKCSMDADRLIGFFESLDLHIVGALTGQSLAPQPPKETAGNEAEKGSEATDPPRTPTKR